MFICLDDRLGDDEFARGVIAAFRRRLRANQVVGALYGLVLAVNYALSSAKHMRPSLMPSVLLSVVALYLILSPWLRRLVLKRQCRKVQVQGMGVTFTGEGAKWTFQLESGECGGHFNGWGCYVKIVEAPEFFLLFPSRKRTVVVPRRAFSPEQADRFSRFANYGFAEARLVEPEVGVQATHV
ncbi:YcxB family protein [Actinospica durhamensis]|uniref:YcxB family protein n=1 Tax=Actinospica durhamensis TaxID=1508375 RepID=A0A941EVN5_9ACTN|nr:YcxB family protein [Actinospica durhamensis]MBR7838118.1 YcxB family protein [Actinospica durhamensis]